MDKKKLIIVESKAKTQSIGKIVGKGYKVNYCLGHIYDLPQKELGIDIEKGFKPIFKIVPGKNKLVRELKDEAKSVDEVILATDPDREGESIAWHLARLFQNKIVKRMTFNEITAKAINEALNNLKDIDMNLVDAQQARRVLDRLVGYKISPLLWKNLNNSRLSAGRVQSVALRMICEREREIEAFVPREYWSIVGTFKQMKAGTETFESDFIGTLTEEIPINNEEEANKLLNELKGIACKVCSVIRRTEKRRPSPPFITSSLQQESARRLGFSASKTMALAQQLYEGIDIGGEEGSVGLITYMRTDSVRVSTDSQEEAKKYIAEHFGNEYIPEKPNVYKSKASAQDAHEAIRPTMVSQEPKTTEQYLSKDQHKLYKLIWARFIASQMESAKVEVTRIDILGNDKYLFRTTGTHIRFDGYMKVYSFKAKSVNGNNDNDGEKYVPPVDEDDLLELLGLVPGQHFTKPPARYSEGSLVKELEDKGIGRPSTYVPTIETLKKREYVNLEKRSFKPTKWGFIVNDLLAKNFSEIMNYEFTKKMEDNLDMIESGDTKWQQIVEEFYKPFVEDLSKASQNMKFEEKTTEKCDKCGADMVVKTGKYGLFLGCGNYPTCGGTKPYGIDRSDGAAAEKKPAEPTGEKCEKCGADMVIRRGRFGPFIACMAYPKCKHKKPYVGDVKCPREKCEGKIVIRRTKKGRAFYGCSSYPDCDFASWQAPVEGENCAKCGSFMTLVKLEGENVKKCARESCGLIVKTEEQEV